MTRRPRADVPARALPRLPQGLAAFGCPAIRREALVRSCPGCRERKLEAAPTCCRMDGRLPGDARNEGEDAQSCGRGAAARGGSIRQAIFIWADLSPHHRARAAWADGGGG